MVMKGQKINDRYQIIRLIGEGGMANVYLAHDTILDRDVAVKILRGDLAGDEKFVKKFQREAISASSLNHPNIVELYDVGEDNGQYFIVMEYVDGKTLKSLVKKRGALTLPEVIDIMLQLTSAIAHAHDSYIIHRDIKPQNVLILDNGMVKITDFGIATALNNHELTETNSVMGSVHYLPPEQANGNGATVKSDIYSLGILMFELLTGKVPFKGDNAVEIAIKQMKTPIPSVRKYDEDIPQSVENVILRSCAKNPKNRYDSAREMHDDLKTVLSKDRQDEDKWVYSYPENELEETKKLSSVSLKVECKVKESVTSGVLTNVAEIAEDNIDDIDSEPGTIDISKINLPDYKGKDSNKEDLTDSDYFYRGQEDDDDFEKVTVENPKIDLALRKYISTVNGENQNREPQVDVTGLVNGTSTTATYKHSKVPVQVKKGDIVIYSIRVYNEGDQDAYANEITDYIPDGLGFIMNHKTNYTNNWKVTSTENKIVKLNTIENATKNLSISDFQGVSSIDDVDVVTGKATIKTNKLKYEQGSTENLIEAFDKTKTEPSSKVVQVACVVVADEISDETIKNIAAVTKHSDANGNTNVTDRDSQPEEIDIANYPDNSNIQDDDDFEKLVLINKKYDLALKKFLSAVEGKEITPSRLQKVNTAPLQEGKEDAEYTMDKSVVKVATGNSVVYTIRVYNEGEQDAYAEEVKDNIPEGLEYIEDSEINKTYRWKVEDGKVVTDYLSKEVNPDKQIKAFDKATGEISYQEVKIEFKVVSKEAKVIKNIAEIKTDDGDDIDSTPDNNKEDEDDQDYDNIIPAVYDLALQKFITKLDDKDITSRVPLLSIDEDGKITYNHTQDPLTVANQSTVVYTIRVYNEGTIEAYVEEIKDNIPEGLVFLPDNEINQKYGWNLYDENGKETDNVDEAKYVRTDYLSEAKSAERGENNQLKPFDKALGITDSNPDYRDVQVAFKVDQSKMSTMERRIKNIAEITADNGDDIDSTPDNDNPDEDDQDDEEIELKYFDLSLLKYVTKVVVNEDGVVKEIETGHTGAENPEPAVKVEINRKKLDKTAVTFIYTIKVTNEGEIEGYAKEVKDRIPEGLEFYTEDNPQWKILEDGIVTTDALADTLLKPGESATVEIALRWKRDANNLGLKVNTAEISKDQNDYNTPDIDSTPDNNIDGEDDQDTAPVILSITTGSAPTYIVLTITIMTILSTGCYAIKKFVL